MKKKIFSLITIFIFCVVSIFASDITFSSGYTRIMMQGNRKAIELTENVKISTGDIDINANLINISGENYTFLDCQGNVKVVDHKRGINITASRLNYNRQSETIIIDGWVELQDSQNEVSVSSSWLEFDLEKGILKLQIHAKILKNTDNGPMICRADNVTFDRNTEKLSLTGNANVIVQDDVYSADRLSVDLKTEEIVMVGDITGTVNG